MVTQAPPNTISAGASFGMTVTPEDGSGNSITSFRGALTVGLGNNTCYYGGTLGGTLTVMASNCVATFTGLTLSAPIGYYYSLCASGGGYGGGVTDTGQPGIQEAVARNLTELMS